MECIVALNQFRMEYELNYNARDMDVINFFFLDSSIDP